MIKTFVEWFKSLRNKDVDDAFNELHRRLNNIGYDTSYPPERGYEYRCGMKVWVIISSPADGREKTRAELMEKVKEVREINVQVAKQFGLNPTGQGPVAGENSTMFVYCGFRSLFF